LTQAIVTFIFNPFQINFQLILVQFFDDEKFFLRRSNDASKRRFVESTIGPVEDDATFDFDDFLVQNVRLDYVQLEQLRSRLVT